MFKLETIQAKEGDCLILHFEDEDNKPRRILIDGGPPGVYRKYLEPRLEQLRQELGTPLKFDLGMVSHIDSDHVAGLLEMTNKMVGLQNGSQDPHYSFSEFWHNSFGGLTKKTSPASLAEFTNAAELASSNDDLRNLPFTSQRAGAIIASIKQGAELEDNLTSLGIRQNPDFDNGLVLAPDTFNFLGLNITVVGPLKTELEDLQDKWKEDLPKAEVQGFLDNSIPNLSSLAFLVEKGEKKLLLTGDARGDKLIEGLELTNKLPENRMLKLDVFKIPHHGSKHNVTQGFFERLPANKYIISANGRHDNPDLDTFDMLIAARKVVEPDENFEIILAMKMKTTNLQNALVAKLQSLQNQRAFDFTFGPGPNGHSIDVQI